jgi:hypothetical protein
MGTTNNLRRPKSKVPVAGHCALTGFAMVRPLQGDGCAAPKIGSIYSHCSSVSSQRPAIPARREALSNSSFAEIRADSVYGIGSRSVSGIDSPGDEFAGGCMRLVLGCGLWARVFSLTM